MAEKNSETNIGLWVVGLGLVMVIMARGLDNLQIRQLGKLQAEVTEARMGDGENIDEKREALDTQKVRNSKNAYYHEWLFVLGTVVLSAGLMITGATAGGMTRVMAMVMMGVILLSIYVGGFAWVGAIASTLTGASGM